jgi:hypothetical protein
MVSMDKAIGLDIDNAINKSLSFVDDAFESQDEAQKQSTRRLELDMSSKFILPHIIRPIITLWAMSLYSYLAIYAMHNSLVDIWIVLAATGTILSAAVSFYFHNKTIEKKHMAMLMSQEKQSKEKVDAAIKIEYLKTRAGLKQEKKDKRQARRDS